MGTFRYTVEISDLDRRHTETIDAFVDTGAAFTALPASFLQSLGVRPIGQRRLLLADGTQVDMDYGRAWATIDGESEITIVVFGQDNGPALLGAYTLEGLSLAVDPVGHRLISTAMIMY
ncbi:MAG: aspartyl protease family protein [Chloroflexi bacterium]|nr:aspartyl protease family protein [Chloroflexota bacterium]